MKKYKVVKTPNLPDNDTAFDLINVADESDYLMCADDEFFEGEIVSENDIRFENQNYVDDNGVGSADFAYRKK